MKLKLNLKQTMCMVGLSVLLGCTQKFNDVKETMSLALLGPSDVIVPAKTIDELPMPVCTQKWQAVAKPLWCLVMRPQRFSPNRKNKIQTAQVAVI
ncbi:hypothetical protein VST7929_03313 [Vibrio stylophorae]|uniref:Lipoprotein n=1 Tax=Vibrio stylophorae TaxID=659351 RepID=A0ABM8ZZ76_9VIBR|nr:hypothetical protein [Vibrio stylophorae]CAH0536300.1 hypothetical protein VST7929_03313 [Vibrio stylophorae]